MAVALIAMCTLSPTSDSQVKGWVKFTQMEDHMMIEGEITGLTSGKHVFHVYEMGDCSAPAASSTGGHFNPSHENHGSPKSKVRHAGDLGNITADKDGTAKLKFEDKVIQIYGDESIAGKSLVIHADSDDLESQLVENASRVVLFKR